MCAQLMRVVRGISINIPNPLDPWMPLHLCQVAQKIVIAVPITSSAPPLWMPPVAQGNALTLEAQDVGV